jgi:hypothetical protein
MPSAWSNVVTTNPVGVDTGYRTSQFTPSADFPRICSLTPSEGIKRVCINVPRRLCSAVLHWQPLASCQFLRRADGHRNEVPRCTGQWTFGPIAARLGACLEYTNRPFMKPQPLTWTLAAIGMLVAVTGCRSIGPGTVPIDRADYSASIADSWKQQTLLNIVKLRYMDVPVFVDVSSVVAGYSLQTGIAVGGTISTKRAVQGNFLNLSGQGIYTDRPTITYTPLTGQKFLRGMVTPIDPKNIFFMLQSGYAADFVLALTVESLNGVRNRSTGADTVREADPEFVRALRLLREVQMAGGVGLRVQENKDKSATSVLFFRHDNLPPEVLDKTAEIRRLLKLPETGQQFNLIYSPAAGAEGELGVGSRSMLQIMAAMATYTDLPEADLQSGRAVPAARSVDTTSKDDPVKIKCSKDKPADAFVAVHYHNQWFWVDDRDWRTKRAFSAIMFLFTMTQETGEERLPLITIPAQ